MHNDAIEIHPESWLNRMSDPIPSMYIWYIDGLRKTGDAPRHKPRLLLLVVLRILLVLVVVVVVVVVVGSC